MTILDGKSLAAVLRSETAAQTAEFIKQTVDAQKLAEIAVLPSNYFGVKTVEIIILPPESKSETDNFNSSQNVPPFDQPPEFDIINSLKGVLSTYKGSVEEIKSEKVREYEGSY